MPDQIGAYGYAIAAYGVGNLLSNIVLGSLSVRRLSVVMFLGWVIVGTGFFWIAFAPDLVTLMVASAFTALGGPMDLTRPDNL